MLVEWIFIAVPSESGKEGDYRMNEENIAAINCSDCGGELEDRGGLHLVCVYCGKKINAGEKVKLTMKDGQKTVGTLVRQCREIPTAKA